MRIAIRLLLEQPELSGQIQRPCGIEDLELAGVELLVELLELLWQHPHLSLGGILEHWRGKPEEEHLARLATQPLEVPADGLAAEFLGAVQRLLEQRTRQRTEQLLFQEQQRGLTETEKIELKQLLIAHQPISG